MFSTAPRPTNNPSSKLSTTTRVVPTPKSKPTSGQKLASSSVKPGSSRSTTSTTIAPAAEQMISWSQSIMTVQYNPLFVTLMEGLRETKHPFLFLVPNALRELILAPNARSKIEPILAQSIPPLRLALSSKTKSTILSSLETVHHLATCTGASLLPHLASLLPPIALHSHSRDTQIKEAVVTCLQGIESGIAYGGDGVEQRVEVQSAAGGKERRVVNLGEWIGVGGGERGVGGSDGVEALRQIKGKIPTYTSVFG
ncbi:hypothetical protein HDU98_007567 [Podochytrium sp. JEL0797]|nr:hypothetical protein HDU98_007567 [Podochytrium sp. JEL0797]